MSEKPTPVPRPRQTKSVDETDRSSKVYENYALPTNNKTQSVYDSLNAQLDELKADPINRPVPTPRARTANAREYENAPETAKPLNKTELSPTRIAAETAKPLNNTELSPARTTGAIRKAPNIPSVKNNLDEPELVQVKTTEESSLKDFDVLSQTSSTSGKSDSKYATPSPG